MGPRLRASAPWFWERRDGHLLRVHRLTEYLVRKATSLEISVRTIPCSVARAPGAIYVSVPVARSPPSHGKDGLRRGAGRRTIDKVRELAVPRAPLNSKMRMPTCRSLVGRSSGGVFPARAPGTETVRRTGMMDKRLHLSSTPGTLQVVPPTLACARPAPDCGQSKIQPVRPPLGSVPAHWEDQPRLPRLSLVRSRTWESNPPERAVDVLARGDTVSTVRSRAPSQATLRFSWAPKRGPHSALASGASRSGTEAWNGVSRRFGSGEHGQSRHATRRRARGEPCKQ